MEDVLGNSTVLIMELTGVMFDTELGTGDKEIRGACEDKDLCSPSR